MSKINANNQDVQFQIGRLLANLRGFDATLPDGILAGLPYPNGSALEYINQVIPPRDYLAEAADAVRNGQDPDPILALASASDRRAEIGGILAREANNQYVDTINSNADAIIHALRTDIFEPVILQLRQHIDEHGGKWDLAAAVKAEDFPLAAAIKSVEEAVGEMVSLHETRQLLHAPEGPNSGERLFNDDAAWTVEPGSSEEIGAASRLDERRVPNLHHLQWWIELLEAGYTPHYPTFTEWQALRTSEEFVQYRNAKAGEEVPAFSGSVRMGAR